MNTDTPKTKFYFHLLIKFCLINLIAPLVFFLTANGQEKPVAAALREIIVKNVTIQLLETSFPVPQKGDCDLELPTCFELKATIYENGKLNGEPIIKLFEEVVSARGGMVSISGFDASVPCSAKTGYPATVGTFCSYVKDDRYIVVYRFENPLKFKNNQFSAAINIIDRQKKVFGYFTPATLEFMLADAEVTIADNSLVTDDPKITCLFINEKICQNFTRNEFGRSRYKPDNNLIQVKVLLPGRVLFDTPAPPDVSEADIAKAQVGASRVRAVLEWLDRQKQKPSAIAELKLDTRDKVDERGQIILTPYELYGFAYSVQHLETAPDPAEQKCGAEGFIPPQITPRLNAREKEIYCNKEFSIFLFGKQNLPNKPFLLKSDFGKLVPLEVESANKAVAAGTGQKSLPTPAAEKVGSDTAVNLREPLSNLDVGIAFTSSVENKTENNITLRKRTNVWLGDIQFAPLTDRFLWDGDGADLLWTPFFLDAKASNGKIQEKTLSLNRILFGSKLSLVLDGKEYAGTSNFPKISDQYTLNFRFVNASDRDFKRAEAKFVFDTVFRFRRLYRPLALQTESVPQSPFDPKFGAVPKPAGNFGYQILPFVGFELGKTYRKVRPPFNNETQSSFVRRFIFGFNSQFDLTRHFKLSIKDYFYVRGEVKDGGRTRNYFSSTLETPIGSFGQNFANSVFFSFERGDQPPFAGPGVNVFKIGYRLTTNFGRNGARF